MMSGFQTFSDGMRICFIPPNSAGSHFRPWSIHCWKNITKKILLIIIAILPKSLHLSLIFATIRAAFDLCSTINWDTNKRKSEHASIYLNQKRIKGSWLLTYSLIFQFFLLMNIGNSKPWAYVLARSIVKIDGIH